MKELKGSSEGEEAGRVFHAFAMFCDQQLQNPDGLEDFKRVEQIRNRKQRELLSLEKMMTSTQGRSREHLKIHRLKAKQWFDLDDREYQRLQRSREAFLQKCLENYLLSLKESDTFNNDVLRFCALWLDNSDSSIANNAVSQHLLQVPSRKFAPLMNQLTSRILDLNNDFQQQLQALLKCICVQHPYHALHQIFASSKSKSAGDPVATSRHAAATKLMNGMRYSTDKALSSTFVALHNANVNYVRFAAERVDGNLKTGARVLLRKTEYGERMEQDAATSRIPPATMKIDIRENCDYSDVPTLVRYNHEFTIASGVSAPKVVTGIATNGQRYKQLVRSTVIFFLNWYSRN